MVQNYDKEGVFVHSFIDSDTILRIADEGYKAQGAGANANPYYIQFELTHEDSQKLRRATSKCSLLYCLHAQKI